MTIPLAVGETEAQGLVRDDPSSPSELSVCWARKLLAAGWRRTRSVLFMCVLFRVVLGCEFRVSYRNSNE